MSIETFLERFFPNEPAHWLAYHDEISSRLPERGRVLDLGCGDNTGLARYRRPRLEVWGTDYQTHPELEHTQWFRLLGAGGAIPFADGTFDLIAAQWVLEHVARPRAFLAEVNRVLKPGGWLVAHSVNARHYFTWIRQMLGLLPHSLVQKIVQRIYGRAEYDTFPTHYRLNTAGRLREFGSAAGLKVERFSQYSDGGFYFRFSPLLRRAAIITDWLLEKTEPGLGRIYFIVAIRKTADPASAGLRIAA